MDTKVVTDYLKEFANPSFNSIPDEPINPLDVERYLGDVESKRLAFITEVLGCADERLFSLYVDRLKDGIKAVRQRGYFKLKDEDITTAILGGIKEMESISHVVVIDRGLLASANKALEVLLPKEQKAADESDGSDNSTTAEKNEKKKRAEPKDFMNLQEVVDYFGLAKNNIKDKRWREEHSFPVFGQIGRGKLTFRREDVEAWIKKNGNEKRG